MQSSTGIDGAVLAPLEEATEDEGKLLSLVCSSTKSSEPTSRRSSTKPGKSTGSAPQTQQLISSVSLKKPRNSVESLEGKLESTFQNVTNSEAHPARVSHDLFLNTH